MGEEETKEEKRETKEGQSETLDELVAFYAKEQPPVLGQEKPGDFLNTRSLALWRAFKSMTPAMQLEMLLWDAANVPEMVRLLAEAIKRIGNFLDPTLEMLLAEREGKLCCEDCGKPYENFLLDVTIPDEQWAEIHPGGGGGVLCANCMVARAEKLNKYVAGRMVFE